MANITVSANTTVVNVDSTTNNVSVSSTLSNIVVGEARFVANSTIREALSVTDTGGDGSLSYSNVSGVFTYTGPSATEVRAHLGNTLPITYDSATGVIGFDQNLDDLTLKKYQETIVANGTASGNVSVNITNGTVHQIDLGGDITGITLTNISTGGSATIFFTQDGIGGAVLDTTTHPSNWTDWKFTNGFTDFSTGANEWNALNVFYDGTDHYATLITETGASVQNSDLANSNVTFNGVTVELGSSGTITDFTSNVLIDANANITQSVTVGEDITVGNALTVTGLTTSGSLSAGLTDLSKLTFSGASAIIDGVTNGGASGNINLDTNQVTVGRPLYTAGVLSESNIVSPGPMSLRGGESINLNNETEFLKIQSNIPDGVTPYIRSYAGFTGSGNANVYIDPLGSQTTDGGFRVLNNSNATIFHVNTSGNVTAEGNIETNSHLITNHITPLSNGNVEVAGNLNVQGNLNYVNVEDLLVNDQSITMNYGNVAQDAMIIVDRVGSGAGSNVELKWNETTDKWQFTNDGSTYYNLPASTSDLAEGTNLYYTDGRFDTRLGTKSTSDLAEGTNLYYTQGRFDTAFTAKDTDDLSQGSTNLYYSQSRTRSDVDGETASATPNTSGTLVYDNTTGMFTYTPSDVAGLAKAALSVTTATPSGDGALAYDSGTGVFTFTPATVYGNVEVADFLANGFGSNTITTTGDITASDFLGDSITSTGGFAINSGDGTTVTSKFGVNSTVTETANIAGKGFGVFNFTSGTNTSISYSGTDSFEWYEIDGNVTVGSTTMTISSVVRGIDSTTAAVSDIIVGQVIANGTSASTPGSTDLIIFPDDAYVVSVNSGAGTVEMSKPAVQTTSFTHTTDGIILDAGLVDTTTGQVIKLLSSLRAIGSGSDSALFFRSFRNTPFGYPASGPVPTDFDIITAGTASDYSMSLSAFMLGQTPVTNDTTVLNSPLGITIGENTQLTNRGENDSLRSFGMNMMWDGLTSYGRPIQPQVLFKSYTDNSEQGEVGSIGGAGPRLFFTSANGNSGDNAFDTYPRANQELGRLSFWGTTGEQLTPSSYSVPSYMSVQAADDWDTWGGGVAGNTNVFMASTASGQAQTYLAFKSGELYLTGSDSKPVTFAPAQSVSGFRPELAYDGSTTTWANINYANTGTSAGAKFTVTNGDSVDAGVVGDMQMSLKRNDNSSNLVTPVRSILSGSASGALENGKIVFTFTDDGSIGSTLNGLAATVSAPSTIDETTYGPPVYGNGNESALGNNVYDLSFAFTSGGVAFYYILSGGSRVSYTDIGGTDPYYFVTQTSGMTVTTVVSSGVTAKEWTFDLEEQSEDLKIKSDGTTVMHFTDQRVFIDEVFRLHNLTTTEINALPSPQSGDTVYNTTLNQICFYNGTAWQKVTSATM